MRAVLPRTGSVPVLSRTASAGSPRVSLSRHDSTGCAFSGAKGCVGSPRISLHFDINHRKDSPAPARGIRRVFSESDIIRSEIGVSKLSGSGSLSFPARIPEDVYLSESDDEGERLVSNGPEIWQEIGFPLKELGFAGRGFGGGGGKSGGDDEIGSCDDRSKIGAYYLEMLKSNPGDSLLLRNYGKFLHEVEKDTVRAEEYYGRAILASPGDGELLSLYGKLIWDTQRDGDRAKSYYDQAVYASPDDCMVLGSYAQFMWEAEEEEEDDTNEIKDRAEASPALVAAF